MERMKKRYSYNAIWPGIVIGLLSVIPIINYANLLCCSWVVLGGVLAAAVLKGEYGQINGGDGAMVGLFAGMFGAVVETIGVGILWFFFKESYLAEIGNLFAKTEFDPSMQDFIAEIVGNPVILIGGTFVTAAISFSIFAMLGGLVGALIFGKGKKSQAELPQKPKETDLMDV